MSTLGKKFDFQNILNNIKSMISPEEMIPNPNPDDAIGIKIAELSVLTQQLTKVHEEQVKELTKMNRLLSELMRDVETLRNSLKPEQGTKEEKNKI
ncbi:hypothetical protein [Coxiella endosymbiont of Amblyomma nuttalli]|uniref:hypothetical protein n=1 Tax=Coxiella endosymbiont of Amblyomma nuttalli TaxID=2749996 RepID=UPI001BA8A0B4|nr:hypothetical protein [Coxiella endosymbiont of Amblyomma nuttalli]QTS84095.1 hypothetical protein CEAn_00593 [Coxiella endosymbiont of Amblyomma nuttalli]